MKLELPVSRPLFRFGNPSLDGMSMSTNTSWTVLTKTTTSCVFEAGRATD